MKVVSLFVKPRPRGPMRAVGSVNGLAGLGLEDDCQQDAAGPRQVLLFSQAVLTALGLSAEAVRANVVVDDPLEALPSGTLLRIGSSFTVRLTIACESCHKLEAQRPGLAAQLTGRRGMLARVVGGGVARVGDEVVRSPSVCRPLDASWRDRVADIVEEIPEGRQISYARLALLAGVQSTYCRAFSRVLRDLRNANRVVAGRATEDHWDGASYYAREERGLRYEAFA